MQAKYVPRFASKTPLEEPAPPSNRWAKETPVKESSTKEPLVNTSLPAKQAPILPPSTLANLTKVSIKQTKAAPSADDFPTLGVPQASQASQAAPALPTGNRPTFSQLSKQWAIQKVEDDKKAKEEAEKVAAEERHLRAVKEKDAAMAREIRKIGFTPLPSMNRLQLSDSDRVSTLSDEADEIDPFDDGAPEEEEDEEENDMVWNPRKNRYDMC